MKQWNKNWKGWTKPWRQCRGVEDTWRVMPLCCPWGDCGFPWWVTYSAVGLCTGASVLHDIHGLLVETMMRRERWFSCNVGDMANRSFFWTITSANYTEWRGEAESGLKIKISILMEFWYSGWLVLQGILPRSVSILFELFFCCFFEFFSFFYFFCRNFL